MRPNTLSSSLRHRLVMVLVTITAALITTTSAAETASAEVICTNGTNWDSVTMSCR
ncbi:hypothetical protein SAMN05216553_12634 [Lentzea fradiae]|uniref:Uncharacterized protein n=1 Tax=Lentzea fradiae TaxID=200378 RepID=A0A1G8D5I8_9PSEU|nr:hypothetical protein [Lentzea fradiae]SDH52961.1 hypothetical protein SAMN05216553_12634 [Lentzea fradiae]